MKAHRLYRVCGPRPQRAHTLFIRLPNSVWLSVSRSSVFNAFRFRSFCWSHTPCQVRVLAVAWATLLSNISIPPPLTHHPFTPKKVLSHASSACAGNNSNNNTGHHHHQKAFRNKSHTSHGHRPGLKRNKSKGKRLTINYYLINC